MSDLAATLTWEVDFWGKQRADYERALGLAQASEVDAAAARLALSTAIAHAYIQLERAYLLLDVATSTLKQREQIASLTRDRNAAGLDSRLEVQQTLETLPAAREQILQLQESIELSRHQLAALLGQGPDRGMSIARPSAAALAEPALPSRLPSELLGRRPDLIAQRWRASAAAQAVKVRQAAFYPNVDLTAFAGFQRLGPGALVSAGERQIGIGPALDLPLFDAGRRRAQLAGADAAYDAAVEQYNQTLADALRDVADQLSSLRSVAAQRAEQQQALAAARSAYDLAVLRYREGVGNYLQVLSTEDRLLAQRSLEADLQAGAWISRSASPVLWAADSNRPAPRRHEHPILSFLRRISMDPSVTAPARAGRLRRLWLYLGLGGCALLGLAYGGYWAHTLRYRQSTDDAYVSGHVVQITPQISGTVVGIGVEDTQFVPAGAPLVRLDQADAKVALDEAEADLAKTVREVGVLYATTSQLQAVVELRDSELAMARQDLARRDRLGSSGAISSEELQHARDAVQNAAAALLSAQQQLRAGRARTEGTDVENHPDVRRAAAAGAQRLSCVLANRAAGAGGRAGREAQRAARPTGEPGSALDGHRAPGRGVGRGEFQGAAARRHARGSARDAHRRSLRAQRGLPRPGRRLRRRHRCGVLACCRLRTPPETGSRSSSACRCASPWIRGNCRPIPCKSACRCAPTSTPMIAPVPDCRSSRRRTRGSATAVFSEDDRAADERVHSIILANAAGRAAAPAAAHGGLARGDVTAPRRPPPGSGLYAARPLSR